MRAVRLALIAGVLASLETGAAAAPLRLVCRDGDGQVVLRRVGAIDWATCDGAADGVCTFTIERAGCACAPKGCCGTDEFTVPVGRRQRVPADAARSRLVLRCARSMGTPTTLPRACEPGVCRYYRTCGYPVCGGPLDGPAPGIEPCTTETEGGPCATWSQTCDPGFGCGVRLLCTDHDPALVCPISRRDAKRDVMYLEDADLDRMLAEIRRVRLATYRYKGEPALATSHLGFIIDDLGASPAVGSDGAHVDLYGYTSMAVAAIQAQQRRIETLEREVAALRNERTPCR